MAEDKRLKIAKRQLMLAQIARREARFALANAIGEEERSADIHARAQQLLCEYEKRLDAIDGSAGSHALQSNLAFVRSLQSMADNAGEAHKDARDQAQWQMQALAKAETRLDAHETKVGAEKRALGELRERRDMPAELTGASGMARELRMARKLQSGEQAGEAVPAKGER